MSNLSTPVANTRRKKNFTGWLLAIVFIAPVALAFFCYFYSDQLQFNTVNKGILITPPIDVKNIILYDSQQQSFTLDQWKNKWLLIYVSKQSCNEQCLSTLHYLQQIYIALGKKNAHVMPVVILPSLISTAELDALKQQYPGFTYGLIDNDHWKVLWQQVPENAQLPNGNGVIIVDPRSRLMMSYPVISDPKHILKDLQRIT